ncbi:MAG TPA: S41 family peptidase [Cellvibrio sp.]|nr:S41 family peptidase [Cellvibrio sp.]
MLKHRIFNGAVKAFAVGLLITGLQACGGGSSSANHANYNYVRPNGSNSDPWQAGVFYPSGEYANRCAVPRANTRWQSFPDIQGTSLDEKNFLRSWSNETYLWYHEIVDSDPAVDDSPIIYFDTLKTTATTASKRDKDNFHFTYQTYVWDGLINQGVDTGYGISWASIQRDPPRTLLVSYTEPGSPAAKGNLQRGARVLKVDGVDLIHATTGEDIAVLNAGLSPSTHGESHTFEVLDYGATHSRTVVLTSGEITMVPVQNVSFIETPSGTVGYLLFNDHLRTAEQGLIAAISKMQQYNVSDLVLDVRYNGGGYLYIANQLAYMIAGSNTQRKFFEQTVYNNKISGVGLGGESLQPAGFLNTSLAGDDLPSLNLSRVFIITSGNTCSASEAIINALRGIDVEVIQIGSQTCGKPYGFYPADNCGTTYFTIQFKGVNYKGFGEYADGFVPSATDNGLDNIKGCVMGDDYTHLLGDRNELNLASALHYRATGNCLYSASEKPRMEKLSGEDYSNVRATLNKPIGLTNRIMK